jgi:hypothetical protein
MHCTKLGLAPVYTSEIQASVRSLYFYCNHYLVRFYLIRNAVRNVLLESHKVQITVTLNQIWQTIDSDISWQLLCSY